MGNNKRKNPKLKKTDDTFHKKKIKVGKKLIKSTETNISIKTRKIVLPDQHIRKDDHLLLFKGKCIKDYIVGTKHTNCNQRIHNLVHIQEMLSTNLNLIEINAGCLIERLGFLLQDSEESVRLAAAVVIKTVLNHMKSEDLLPFLHVFMTQLSSGMLHIDKGIQKTTVHVLHSLFQNHLPSTMKFSDVFLSSLVTLLLTNKNKSNILDYFQALSHILKFCSKSEDTYCQFKRKNSSVSLFQHTLRKVAEKNVFDKSEILEKLCMLSLPHIETIWLEDAPSQVYSHVEPGVLRSCASLVDMLKLIRHCPSIVHSHTTLTKLNHIAKSVAARFPLVCSNTNKDQKLLWVLNLKIAQFLVSIQRYSKVEEYFLSCFRLTLQNLTKEEVSEALSLLARIPELQPDTIRDLQQYTNSHHSTAFLSQFVRTGWIHSVDLSDITQSLERDLLHVAPDIVNSFYRNRGSFVPSIYNLCLDKKVFSKLSEVDQIKCLELYYSKEGSMPARALSNLGQSVGSTLVRRKFYSLLQALFHERKIGSGDYISIVLSQANRDGPVKLEHVTSFTSELVLNFNVLPPSIKENLFSLCAVQITDILYDGLSDFSLTSFLLLLRELNSMAVEKTSETNVKLCKIICSLIFNVDSLSEWGGDVVELAVKLSVEHTPILAYVTTTLENKPVDILLWYLKVLLKCKRSDVGYRNGIRSLWKFLEVRISNAQRAELLYRMGTSGIGIS